MMACVSDPPRPEPPVEERLPDTVPFVGGGMAQGCVGGPEPPGAGVA